MAKFKGRNHFAAGLERYFSSAPSNPCVVMSAGKAVPKVLAVTLIRSGIGKPYWQKRTLKALGLVKIHKTIIHKNIPSVVGMLSAVKELIHVRPVMFRYDIENSPNKGAFLLHNGEVFIDPSDLPAPDSHVDCQRTSNCEENSSNND